MEEKGKLRKCQCVGLPFPLAREIRGRVGNDIPLLQASGMIIGWVWYSTRNHTQAMQFLSYAIIQISFSLFFLTGFLTMALWALSIISTRGSLKTGKRNPCPVEGCTRSAEVVFLLLMTPPSTILVSILFILSPLLFPPLSITYTLRCNRRMQEAPENRGLWICMGAQIRTDFLPHTRAIRHRRISYSRVPLPCTNIVQGIRATISGEPVRMRKLIPSLSLLAVEGILRISRLRGKISWEGSAFFWHSIRSSHWVY